MTDLLKVLDMSEDEQITWFYRRHEKELHDIVWIAPVAKFKDYRLADLAFRLRDEAVKENHKNYHNAIYEIQEYLGEDSWATAFWGECYAKPIHWIIAALIAKEQK